MAKEFFEGFIEAKGVVSNKFAYSAYLPTLISSTGATTSLRAWNSQNQTEAANLTMFFEGLGKLGDTKTVYTKIKIRLCRNTRTTGTSIGPKFDGNADGFQGVVDIIIDWGNQVIIRGSLLDAAVDSSDNESSYIEVGKIIEVFDVVSISGSSGETSIEINSALIEQAWTTTSAAGNPAFTGVPPILIINTNTRQIIGIPLFYNYAGTGYTKTSLSIETDDGRSVSGGGIPGEATGTKISKLINVPETKPTDKFVISRDDPVGDDYEHSYNIEWSSLLASFTAATLKKFVGPWIACNDALYYGKTPYTSSFWGYTVAHGLEQVPDMNLIEFKCTTAERGYLVGDVVTQPAEDVAGQIMNSHWADATNLGVAWYPKERPARVLPRDTYASPPQILTPTKWSFRLVALNFNL